LPLYEVGASGITRIPENRFDATLVKSKDLQRLVRANIGMFFGDLFVLSQAHGEGDGGQRSIDLLCIDREANLVVVDLQRVAEPGMLDLSALRHAAAVSTMTFDDAVSAAARDAGNQGKSIHDVQTEILDFLDWTSQDDGEFGAAVRVILVSPDFSGEIIRSVLWLNRHGLDIQCFRLRAHRLLDKRLLFDLEQILPIPEAAAYELSARKFAHAANSRFTERRHRNRRFVAKLWETGIGFSPLFQNERSKAEHSSLSVRIQPGISLIAATRSAHCLVELSAHRNNWNDALFQRLTLARKEFEVMYGHDLVWREQDGHSVLRAQEIVEGGYLSPEESWPAIHEKVIDKLILLDKSFHDFAGNVPKARSASAT
jgi:hypothetical protein